jgi:hypothetical protein
MPIAGVNLRGDADLRAEGERMLGVRPRVMVLGRTGARAFTVLFTPKYDRV